MREPVRVVALVDTPGGGGAERSTVELMPHLAERGVSITLVALRAAPPGRSQWLDARGVTPVVLGATSLLDGARRFRRLLRSDTYDLVHTALFASDTVGRIATIGTGVPVVTSLVSTPYSPYRRMNPELKSWKIGVIRRFERLMARRTTRFHAVSAGVAGHASRELHIAPSRITVAERGREARRFAPIDASARQTLREELGCSSDQHLVLAVGRIEYPKAFETLVEAVATLPSSVRLAIAGPPRSRIDVDALHDAVARTGTADRVVLLGERDDVPRLMRAADLLCVSSRYEGTSGVALEAMAAGLPIVATDVEGLQGILIDGVNALLAPIESPARLGEAIWRVLADEGLAQDVSRRALAEFERRFTAEHAADRLASLYLEVVGSPR